MIIIDKGRSSPDIWPETPHQDTGTKDIILTIWYKEAIKQIEINLQQHHFLTSNAKEARYINYTRSNYKNSHAHPATDT